MAAERARETLRRSRSGLAAAPGRPHLAPRLDSGLARVVVPTLLAALGVALVPALSPGPGLEAQEDRPPSEEIVSDRPGIGNGSYVLAPRVFQLEGGASRSDQGPLTDYLLGEVLLRYGLIDRLELRAGLGSIRFRSNGVSEEGVEDFVPGLKVRIASARGGALTFSGLGALSVPTGSDAFTADEATGTLAALADASLSEAASVAVNVGFTSALDDGHDDVWTVTVTPAHAVPGIEGLGVYGGWAGSFSDGSDDHVLEGGVTYLLGTEIQLDVNGGWDPDSGDFFFGVGAAHRWR